MVGWVVRMTKWWKLSEREKRWVNGPYNYGHHVPEAGPCPHCGSRILYNGNYFCEDWGFDYTFGRLNGPCDWALAHPAETEEDKAIVERLGLEDD